MSKIDFKKEMKHLYRPSAKQFEVVIVPEMNFLMIDGHGDPNTAQTYKEAVEALYAIAFKLKFLSKKGLGKDYVIPPLEGLWWAEDMDAFVAGKKDDWDWTMMIMQPEWITSEMFDEVFALVKKAKNPPALSKMGMHNYDEGLSIQIMHLGSYDDEAPTLDKMHSEFIPKNNYTLSGKHHEIYLSDPRKVQPEKLKTVLRQPVRRS